MKMVICKCSYTKELYNLSRGHYSTFIPLERYLNSGVILDRPAMPGYMFVPNKSYLDFRRWAPMRFRLQVLYDELLARPMVVELDKLYEMQEFLNFHFNEQICKRYVKAPVKEEEPVFTPGDSVIILKHPYFEGAVGTFVKYKGDQRGRVEVKGIYFDLPLIFIGQHKKSID